MPRKPNLAIGATSFRPTVVGRHHAVSSGHYLASLAAMRVLDRGGNAIDAGVTAAMALAVVQPDIVSFGGVAPTLIYLKEEDRVVSLAGLGWWPKGTDVEHLRKVSTDGHIPEGVLRTVMPAAPATHIEALRRYGTISFAEAAQAAMELARDGFPVYPLLANNLKSSEAMYAQWPSSAAVFLPGGKTPKVGDVFVQAELARSIQGMMEAERSAKGDRSAKLRAVHDFYYKGPIAAAIADYHKANGGFVTREDLASYETPVENSIHAKYRDYTIHSCDVWCQGIVLPQTLKTLEGFDLQKLGHNTPDYLHTIAEALNLSFADREAYVGDPKFVNVPTQALLSDAYAAKQRARIDMQRAFGKMPEPGNPTAAPTAGAKQAVYAAARGSASRMSPDTIYASVTDKFGNAYSATLSDTSYDTPVIPGYGAVISSRGCQNRLDPKHPSVVAPGKRPRLTPAPAMAFKDGKFFMAWGTPGGDVQMQAMLQVFLNVTEFGKRMQEAVEAPRVCTKNFPDSFAPHPYYPGKLLAEANLPAGVAEDLKRRGHDVETVPVLPPVGGAVCAIVKDPESGLFNAGADPRREAYALAW
jgi:gamma-glutamyltranspeptidase/glutathione hydrolase